MTFVKFYSLRSLRSLHTFENCFYFQASSEYALRFVSSRAPVSSSKITAVTNLSQGLDNEEKERFIKLLNTYKSTSTLLINNKMSGAQIIRRRKEKSAAILVSIIVVFLLCHIHRLAFRLYEFSLPETSLYEHFMFCDKKGRYHVPVAIYFLTHMHYLFLAINSSVNFVIYCAMGQNFSKHLAKIFCK